jgi:hypothetical protein
MAKKDTCIRKDELTQEPGYAQAVGQVGVSEDCCDYYNTDGPGPYPANPLAQIFAHQRKFMRRFSHLMPGLQSPGPPARGRCLPHRPD